MKKFCYLIVTVLLVFGVAACSVKKDKDTSSTNPTKEVDSKSVDLTPTIAAPTGVITPTVTKKVENATGSVEDKDIMSEAIAENIIGDDGNRTISIYLPPSYKSSSKNYPVVYFLSGFGDSCQGVLMGFKAKLDDQIKYGAKEFILVSLDGINQTGGSFYVNSPIMGNWEDFVVKEVVSFMDKNYRTIAKSTSRGISGFSMGGFGALNLSLRHPDIFSSSLVFCPGVFAENDLDSVLDSWSGSSDITISYAQAFSPNKKDKEGYGNILNSSDIKAKNQVWKDWMNGYSNWGTKLDKYLALKKPLKAIEIIYSHYDNYSWIPSGCKHIANLMKKKKINYIINEFDGGHSIPQDAIENYFVPFFGDNLNY